jgi:hypothetical protein
VPLCQQNISLEKASVLFNMAALFTQIGTRSNRQTLTGLDQAVTSFQKAAGENRTARSSDLFRHAGRVSINA